ncbi:short-chain dehydrogenase [Actinosynnema sp. ALI-1.44]|uniref:SDR family NAD(P)-dependent oxidoreductase n=1 Tax=Actinosynnema sp. ALI-1.44 TaxID=1933779 RepID=UPI00097C2321|nr:SDR family NAD(P)-dependent oxidoreductase [Actinosynnema sp. ALI-1.44]ONI91359.1 short-chain dehydrogenase [Actinosynnema sp. ALI-1.44]
MAKQKWTATDVPAQDGRTAIVTGANTGIGFEAAKVLAARGATVVLGVRDLAKGEAACHRIKADHPGADVRVQRLDLSSLDSVRKAADELRASHSQIDLLINNAGVMYTPKQTTSDGFELQFGTNHLGHFAFTGLLLDMLLPVPDSRVVTVSSAGHRIKARINFDDLQWERSYDRVAAYGQSKLANLLFTYQLQHRLSGNGKTIATAAHPGLSRTELTRHVPTMMHLPYKLLIEPFFSQDSHNGSLPTLRAATDPHALGGQYYGPSGIGEGKGAPTLVKSSAQSHDTELQRHLWTVSEELTGVKFPV